MEQLDLFYWAYQHYKKEFENNRDDYLFKKGVNSKKAPNDVLTMVEVTCEIEEDWIAAIEKGLDYIQKAIKEDRQFIRNEGEVLPIEKIRRVSKDSITDLSKHSNYITKLPEEGENVVPEKLMMTKRENDYSIYENRVVYTTLAYLKDFVAERLEKIKDAVNKYEGKAQIIKKIELGYRTVDVSFTVHDIRKNDPLAMKRNNAQEKIKRLDTILNGVLVLLKTPLMQEVSKTPMVTRPITKTNVLKMNTNFKETLYVFDYVCSYNKPGFTITETTKEIKPLSVTQEDTFTDVILLYSFLTYEYNNHLEEELQKNYLVEEKYRETLRDSEILEKIEKMRAKAKASEKSMLEFMILLDEGYKVLEKRLKEAQQELQDTIDMYDAKIDELNENHRVELENLETSLTEQFNNEKEALINEHNEQISAKDGQIAALNEQNATLNAQMVAQENAHQEQLKRTVEAYQNKIKEMRESLDVAEAENLALRIMRKQKINPKDYTSKERFDELERELNVLERFVNKAWSATKKEIKKKHFGKQENKGEE